MARTPSGPLAAMNSRPTFSPPTCGPHGLGERTRALVESTACRERRRWDWRTCARVLMPRSHRCRLVARVKRNDRAFDAFERARGARRARARRSGHGQAAQEHAQQHGARNSSRKAASGRPAPDAHPKTDRDDSAHRRAIGDRDDGRDDHRRAQSEEGRRQPSLAAAVRTRARSAVRAIPCPVRKNGTRFSSTRHGAPVRGLRP